MTPPAPAGGEDGGRPHAPEGAAPASWAKALGSAAWVAVGLVVAKRAAAGAVLASGFRAVSDDDYARVVIAESWARAPHLDPSGTSWLPFPFWVVGAAMRVAGRSLDVARVMALALGVASALLVYLAARWIGEGRGAAFAGALAAAVFPWSARLGVATVPELPTAALTLLAMAALVPVEASRGSELASRRVVGSLALLAATLSRYEAWPVAAAFAAIGALDARRSREARPALVASALVALAGPAAWIAWNRVAHGDALHFLARVTAYRQALGAAEGSASSRLFAYPIAIVREAPEVALLVAVGAALVAARGRRALLAALAPYARPWLLVAAQIAALSLAMMKDGAPTHHPERAVLAAMLLAAVLGGALVARALAPAPVTRRALGAVAVAGLAATIAALTSARNDTFVQREDEEAVGGVAASRVPSGERLLVEVPDYGYLAVQAAFGRPEDAITDRSVDPRQARVASSFEDRASLEARLSETGARWAAARVAGPVRSVMGDPVAAHRAWGLFRDERTNAGAPRRNDRR